MEACPGDLDMLSLNAGLAHRAVVLHVVEIVLLAVDLVIELVIFAHDGFLTNTTDSSMRLEILFTDGLVLKEQVGVAQGLVAHVTLHAARVVVGLIVDDTIPGYLLFAHTALLLT